MRLTGIVFVSVCLAGAVGCSGSKGSGTSGDGGTGLDGGGTVDGGTKRRDGGPGGHSASSEKGSSHGTENSVTRGSSESGESSTASTGETSTKKGHSSGSKSTSGSEGTTGTGTSTPTTGSSSTPGTTNTTASTTTTAPESTTTTAPESTTTTTPPASTTTTPPTSTTTSTVLVTTTTPEADAGNAGVSVLTMHNHVNRDGTFMDPLLTESAAMNFGLDSSFAGGFAGMMYASPLYVESGVNGNGTFYVATEDGTVYALDETTGEVDWQWPIDDAGAPPQQTGTCGNIGPIGITGTPAIDLGTRLMVFDQAIAGPDSGGNLSDHLIEAISIDTGDLAWSVDVSTLRANGHGFTPNIQNQRAAVLILNGTAYVAYSGNWGDCGGYYGWVVGVPLSGTGAQAWATTGQGSGIWGSGGPASDGTSIFVSTGNGENDSANWQGSEALFRLDPGPSFSGDTRDYWFANNWASLDGNDLDLSGSEPLVIDAPALTPSQLVLVQGKDGNLYLLDRTDLGGMGAADPPANVGFLNVQNGEISNAGAWATVNGDTYVVIRPNGQSSGVGCPNGNGDLVAVKLDPTSPNKMTVVWCAQSGGNGSPSITTTDGNNNAMVWAFAAQDQGGSGNLYSWDLVTGNPVFTGGGYGNQASNVQHFTTPIAVHGRIFVGGTGQLYAFKAQ